MTGTNEFGDIGFPQHVKKKYRIERIPTNESDHFVKVACGDHNMAAITRNGKLFVSGCNFIGELGIGNISNQYGLTQCTSIWEESDPIVDVACKYYGIYVLKSRYCCNISSQ